MQCFATMHSFFISTVNPPLFTRTDLEECPDDGESGVDEDPGLGDEQQQVVQLERGLGVVVQPPHLAQYSTVQYSTVQYSAVQYSTVQYSTAPHLAHCRQRRHARHAVQGQLGEGSHLTKQSLSQSQLALGHVSSSQPITAHLTGLILKSLSATVTLRLDSSDMRRTWDGVSGGPGSIDHQQADTYLLLSTLLGNISFIKALFVCRFLIKLK